MFDTKDNKTGLKTVPNSAQPSGWVGGWMYLGVNLVSGIGKQKKIVLDIQKKLRDLKKFNFNG